MEKTVTPTLVTLNKWIIAPDGQQYRAIYGDIEQYPSDPHDQLKDSVTLWDSKGNISMEVNRKDIISIMGLHENAPTVYTGMISEDRASDELGITWAFSRSSIIFDLKNL